MFGVIDGSGLLRLDGDGLAAYIDLSISGGFGGDIGLAFDVSATLELYVGSLNQKVLTLADGTSVTVKQGFKLHMQGSVTFLGFASASGAVEVVMHPR